MSPAQENMVSYDDAQERSESLIAEIENFDSMDYREQVSHLTELMDEMKNDNENRFLVEYLAARAYDIELTAEQAELEEKRPQLDRTEALDLDPKDLERVA